VPVMEDFPRVLQGARRGSDAAWATLYRALAPGVIGYLRAQSAPDPEDLAGEVFLQVVRDLHRFEGDGGQFRSWVFSIAHHRLLDARRRAVRRPASPAPPGDLHDRGAVGDSEEEALALLGIQRVARLLDRLTPDQRNVLLLRIVGDLSVEQVGAALSKRPGAVRVLQHRGLVRLRREMTKGGVTR
jgi:RNA polymerase sigma factor (sigma-70 family)